MTRNDRSAVLGLGAWLLFLVLPALAVRMGWLPRPPRWLERGASYAMAYGILTLTAGMLIHSVKEDWKWIVPASLLLGAVFAFLLLG